MSNQENKSKDNIIKVTAAIIEQNGKILICQRKLRDSSAGQWEFPGGKIEPSETGEQCLARELMEELNLTVQVGEEIEKVEHRYGEKIFEITFYHANIIGGEMCLNVHHDAVWADRESLASYDFLPADVEFVGKYAQIKKAHRN